MMAIDTGENWCPNAPKTAAPEAGTGIFVFTLGAEVQILDSFMAAPQSVVAKYSLEQNWVAAQASRLDFWPDDWVISFKRYLRRPFGVDLFLEPKKPQINTKIIAFHGDPAQ